MMAGNGRTRVGGPLRRLSQQHRLDGLKGKARENYQEHRKKRFLGPIPTGPDWGGLGWMEGC